MEAAAIYVLLTLFFSACFSGIEIAFVRADKLQVEVKKQMGVMSARIIADFFKRQSHFLTTTLVGNNLMLVIYGIYSAELITAGLNLTALPVMRQPFVQFLAQTFISTLFVLIFAEFLPKAFFRINPTRTLAALAVPFKGVYWVFYPLTMFVVFLSDVLMRYVLGVRPDPEANERRLFTRYDFFEYVSKSSSDISDKPEANIDVDHAILKNAIDFPHVRVRDCMIPRTDIVAIEENDGLEVLEKQFTDSGFSKVLIYKDNIDNIIGYAHIIDLYQNPGDLKSILLQIPIASEAMPAHDLLKLLVSRHKSIALVVDEYGGTSGLVSIENILEELFGKIEDEFDSDDLLETRVNAREYIFSARHKIDYLNETYDLHLPEGDYDTLGGLVYTEHQNIPEVNQVIELPRYRLIVLRMSHNKIEDVRLLIKAKDEI